VNDQALLIGARELIARPTHERTLGTQLATVISSLASPPIAAVALILLAADSTSTALAWTWAGLHVALVVLGPVLFLVYLLHRGLVSDLDVQRRQQRAKPLTFTLLSAGASWLALSLGGASRLQVYIAAALFIEIALLFLITWRWKISVHCSAAASLGAATWFLAGTALPLLLGLPLIAWSRVRLRRHTFWQTVAGSALGIWLFVGLFLLRQGGR
jgi:membrane-associated phospholipid phosphatase